MRSGPFLPKIELSDKAVGACATAGTDWAVKARKWVLDVLVASPFEIKLHTGRLEAFNSRLLKLVSRLAPIEQRRRYKSS
jgi:hypothetical protein